MFNVGGGELIFIFLLALIVLGPDKLPAAARQAGKYMSEFRRMSHGFQQELKDAMDIPELNDLKATLTGSTMATASTTNPSNPTTDAATSEPPSEPTRGSEPLVTQLDAPPSLVAPTETTTTMPSPTTPSIVVEGPAGSFS